MSPKSPVFLEVDEFDREPNVRRARSNEYLDYLKEQETWKRHDQARQMVRYRDRKHFGATEQSINTNRLAVPIYEVSPRRPRAKSDTRSPSRDFKTLEVRPKHYPGIGEENLSESKVLNIGVQRGSTQSRAPMHERSKIKIPAVVFQEHPPDAKTPYQKFKGSPDTSPRSLREQSKLQYKYLLLQNKFADIGLTCVRYINEEVANSQDLTFEKLSEQVKGFTWELQVWSHVANIQSMAKGELPEDARAVVDSASRTMDRLIARVEELHNACSRAKQSDLKFDGLPKIDDEDTLFDNVDDGLTEQDLTESLGYIIDASLRSIRLQIKSLKRLIRSLQEITPQGRDEMVAMASLLGEVERYFGSEAALDRISVDKKFAGRRALAEARYAAAR